MEGPQIRLPVQLLRETMADDDALRGHVYKALGELAAVAKLPPEYLAPLLEDAFAAVRKETRRFKADPDDPFPPGHVNNLSIQIILPQKGKVGVSELNAAVCV